MTALMLAALCGKLDCLDYLVAKGANLNAQNKASRRPAAALRRGAGVGVGAGTGGRAELRCSLAPLLPLVQARALHLTLSPRNLYISPGISDKSPPCLPYLPYPLPPMSPLHLPYIFTFYLRHISLPTLLCHRWQS